MSEYSKEANADSLRQETSAGSESRERGDKTQPVSEEKAMKKCGRRGRRPAKVDVKSKLERSRQSARECRARKKLRYQYLEEIVANRESAIFALREELSTYKQWSREVDAGNIPDGLSRVMDDMERQSSSVEVQQLQF